MSEPTNLIRVTHSGPYSIIKTLETVPNLLIQTDAKSFLDQNQNSTLEWFLEAYQGV